MSPGTGTGTGSGTGTVSDAGAAAAAAGPPAMMAACCETEPQTLQWAVPLRVLPAELPCAWGDEPPQMLLGAGGGGGGAGGGAGVSTGADQALRDWKSCTFVPVG